MNEYFAYLCNIILFDYRTFLTFSFMKIEVKTVMDYLKPKVKALGFKKEIVESIAADIADNLAEVDDEATEEDIEAVVKPAVDAMIPSLKLAQRLTNQGIEEFRQKMEKKNPKPVEKPVMETPPIERNDDTPEWAKTLIESQKQQQEQNQKLIENLQAEIAGMKSKNTAKERRSTLETLLKNTGSFGKRTIKSFERMTFQSDEEFDEFVEDVKEDLKALNQERSNNGLSKLGSPSVIGPQEKPKPKTMTEEEISELADIM